MEEHYALDQAFEALRLVVVLRVHQPDSVPLAREGRGVNNNASNNEDKIIYKACITFESVIKKGATAWWWSTKLHVLVVKTLHLFFITTSEILILIISFLFTPSIHY